MCECVCRCMCEGGVHVYEQHGICMPTEGFIPSDILIDKNIILLVIIYYLLRVAIFFLTFTRL